MSESTDKQVREVLKTLGALAARVRARFLDGVVFLDGEVSSEDDRAALDQALRAVAGVQFVQDRLRVTPTQDRPGSTEWRRGHP